MKSSCAVHIFIRRNEPTRSRGLFRIVFRWDAVSADPVTPPKNSSSQMTRRCATTAIWATPVVARGCLLCGPLTPFVWLWFRTAETGFSSSTCTTVSTLPSLTDSSHTIVRRDVGPQRSMILACSARLSAICAFTWISGHAHRPRSNGVAGQAHVGQPGSRPDLWSQPELLRRNLVPACRILAVCQPKNATVWRRGR
jgi:hypothetical protein